jgi:hypothetical protein
VAEHPPPLFCRRRVELLQDLEFPAACQRIKATPDGQFIYASGYHPPIVKLYDLANLSLKFDRHLDAEVVDFQVCQAAWPACGTPAACCGINVAHSTPALLPRRTRWPSPGSAPFAPRTQETTQTTRTHAHTHMPRNRC